MWRGEGPQGGLVAMIVLQRAGGGGVQGFQAKGEQQLQSP
jgi:hypothetical protein